jgi:hypothetical protein
VYQSIGSETTMKNQLVEASIQKLLCTCGACVSGGVSGICRAELSSKNRVELPVGHVCNIVTLTLRLLRSGRCTVNSFNCARISSSN